MTKPRTEARHRTSQTSANNRKALVRDARDGRITLVLGAGVSMARGLPSWRSLARGTWARVRGRSAVPAWLAADPAGESPHPFAYAMVFEELEHDLRRAHQKASGASDASTPIAAAAGEFADILREQVYASEKPRGGDDTLGVLCDAIRREQARGSCRIQRVISFNVDDLLERECNRGHDPGRTPVVWPISRASFHPRRDAAANGCAPIPVYHVHGYLPEARRRYRDAPDTLVFTDAQYWASVASPGSFANRVLVNALHDGHCVFVGLSMTDMNLMRWLGVRQIEIEEDHLARCATGALASDKLLPGVHRALDRHYWVARPESDPSGLVASHLERRGVRTIHVDSWADPFADLVADCFPDEG